MKIYSVMEGLSFNRRPGPVSLLPVAGVRVSLQDEVREGPDLWPPVPDISLCGIAQAGAEIVRCF